jgi:hypothetical protein
MHLAAAAAAVFTLHDGALMQPSAVAATKDQKYCLCWCFCFILNQVMHTIMLVLLSNLYSCTQPTLLAGQLLQHVKEEI